MLQFAYRLVHKFEEIRHQWPKAFIKHHLIKKSSYDLHYLIHIILFINHS